MTEVSKSTTAILLFFSIVNTGHGQSLPTAPSNLMITPNATSMTLSWTQPDDVLVDVFIILYDYNVRGCGDEGSVSLAVNGSLREHTLTSLEEDTDYTVFMAARNFVGEGPGITGTATTLTAVPSAPPTSLTITSVTFFSIAASWGEIPCLDRNTEIVYYRVNFSPVFTGISHLSAFSFLTRNNFYEAARLFPRATYMVDVAGYDTLSGRPGTFATVTVLTDLSPDLGFFVDNHLIPNNSMVEPSMDFIIVHCVTNLTSCCTEAEGATAGEWYLPGQDQPVGGFSAGYITYRVPGAVVLENNARTAWPRGIYTCQIPDENSDIRTLYIGINTAPPMITNMEFNLSLLTLTCTSQGGPVDSVTWTRNGIEVGPEFAQTQTLTDTVSATYEHTLTSGNVDLFVGNFTCCVDGNNDSVTLNVQPSVNEAGATQSPTLNSIDPHTTSNRVGVGIGTSAAIILLLLLVGIAAILTALRYRKRQTRLLKNIFSKAFSVHSSRDYMTRTRTDALLDLNSSRQISTLHHGGSTSQGTLEFQANVYNVGTDRVEMLANHSYGVVTTKEKDSDRRILCTQNEAYSSSPDAVTTTHENEEIEQDEGDLEYSYPAAENHLAQSKASVACSDQASVITNKSCEVSYAKEENELEYSIPYMRNEAYGISTGQVAMSNKQAYGVDTTMKEETALKKIAFARNEAYGVNTEHVAVSIIQVCRVDTTMKEGTASAKTPCTRNEAYGVDTEHVAVSTNQAYGVDPTLENETASRKTFCTLNEAYGVHEEDERKVSCTMNEAYGIHTTASTNALRAIEVAGTTQENYTIQSEAYALHSDEASKAADSVPETESPVFDGITTWRKYKASNSTYTSQKQGECT